MKINRLKIVLPARMKATAHHDARRIAEQLAERMYQTGSDQREVKVNGAGQGANEIGLRVSGAVRGKGGSHGR